MEMERRKKRVFMLAMSITLILVLAIGGTYAWFTLSLKGTKTNVLKAGELTLFLEEENTIGIRDEMAVPTLDVVGQKRTPITLC